jgi:hypothetical protein
MANTARVQKVIKPKTVKTIQTSVANFISSGENGVMNIGDRVQLVTVTSGNIVAIIGEYLLIGDNATANKYVATVTIGS